MLRAVGFVLIHANLSFELGDPVLGRSKLMRKLLSQIKGMLTICFNHAGGLMKQSKNCLPCFIDLIDTIRSRVPRSRCKRND